MMDGDEYVDGVPPALTALVQSIAQNKAFTVLHVPVPPIVVGGVTDAGAMRGLTGYIGESFIEHGIQRAVNPDPYVFTTSSRLNTADAEWKRMASDVREAAVYTNRYDGTIGVDLRFLDDSMDEELVDRVARDLDEWSRDARVIAFVGDAGRPMVERIKAQAEPRRIYVCDVPQRTHAQIYDEYRRMVEEALHRLEHALGPVSEGMNERFEECLAERSGYGNLPHTVQGLKTLIDAALAECLESVDC
ncbi:hypothetical protein PG2029B_1219 [Bifidobacterium pseudolongum subsp. globosum]|uniref:Uncharacterized protein n=1 Tax=Bifidobacterium pseudolongum subsp. globosum TaxID=1690 RepID=A0A4Q5AF73_9BIFI|nr:hypothetical protein [Bifidobacterium pseudolongum]RYQ26622.1 hypothetical protein PG2032B_1218 [Bifidobacterium pseudolongum subsp. globosum]RYQ28614.1 hypothetical protein PG2029B_1219 [Bifidobacterium pseudolongum subsp. globosum]